MAAGAAGLRTASGRWLLRTTVDQLTGRHGLPTVVLHRAELQQMLLDAASGADLRTGHKVTGVTSGVDAAEVSYVTSGCPGSERADLVVAADGVHSASRRTLFPNHPGPPYAGYVTWRGLAPAEAAPTNLPGLTESWGRGQRFGVAPLADGRVYWFATRTRRGWQTLATAAPPFCATWLRGRCPPRRICGHPPTRSGGSHQSGRSWCGKAGKSE